MVYKIIRKIKFFLIILLLPLFSFAFDAESTHPALTEEIVKYYNSFAERKITNEELELIKQGSILEDSSPRWANHFYDVFNNSGLNLNTARASKEAINFFLSLLPYYPLKSPDWAKDEIVQSKYLNNRTYQLAKRLYFENKKEAFITLGYLIHLLEDLGVPDHARGDAHGGIGDDPKSNYEEYAKDITDRYYLTFSRDLIKNGINPYSFKDLDSIFASLAKFTASNWFSEDTIGILPFPKLDASKYKVVMIDGKEWKMYYDASNKNLLICAGNKCTTDYKEIHQAWFNKVVPEIIKHGAALLNLYFSEVKEMERESSLLNYEKDIQRMVKLAIFFNFPFNLRSYTLSLLWQGAESLYKGLSSIKETLFPAPKIAKTEYTLKSLDTQEKITKEQEITKENKTIYKEKRREEVTYKERKIEKSNEINKLKETLIKISTSTITTTSIKTISQITTSSLKQDEDLDEDQDESEKEEESSGNFIHGGGADIKTYNQSKPKDPCENYKNNQYPNILISEIQYESLADTNDEYIELYNPTDKEIDLTCWSLEKYPSITRTGNGQNTDITDENNMSESSVSSPLSSVKSYTLIPQSKFQGKIQPNSFFLISAEEYKNKYQADLTYAKSYSISKNNTIILKKPNGEISDLVGYGDNKEKIYQYEKEPFIIVKNLQNNPNSSSSLKSIQRKNLQDTDNNSKDFWLRKPNPENSNSPSRKARKDFIDLSEIKISNFIIESTSTEDNTYLNISFNIEKNAEIIQNLQNSPTSSTSTDQASVLENYFYDLLISTSTDFSTFKLEDFGASPTFPTPKFDNSTTSLSFNITKCPSTSTLYYFALFLKDKLDKENYTSSTTSAVLPDYLCDQEWPNLIQNISSTTATSTGKILISEVYVKEGTSSGEFIELYNPNEFDIDLTGWRIERIKNTGSSTTIIPSSKFKGIIPAFSYFLLANINTSSEFNIQPDFLYPKSYDLAKNNALILYDKNNNQIDYVCWGNVPNFNNCVSNSSSIILSLQRKKTSVSTAETINAQNLGNAYSTDNPINDFVYSTSNPENSSIKRETIKDIVNFNVEIENTNYILSWFSPAYYFDNLIYEIKISTSTEHLLIATSSFLILSDQLLELNICSILPNIIPDEDITFNLYLINKDKVIKSSSTSTKMIPCTLELIYDDRPEKETRIATKRDSQFRRKTIIYASWIDPAFSLPTSIYNFPFILPRLHLNNTLKYL